jgi:hypothetical protein
MDNGNFIMKRFSFKSTISLLAVFIFIQHYSITPTYADSPQMVAPPYNATNRHNVNMISAHVQMTHSDVSIGGLSHSISMHQSNWVGPDDWPIGPTDKYEGRLFSVPRRDYELDNRQWIVVSDGESTQYFNPGEVPNVASPDSSGYFPPVTHKGYKLRQVAGVGMVMTRPDGAQVIFGGAAPYNIHGIYNMTEIRSPNGLITKINLYTDREPASVTTNTGFQLRYYYVPNYTPLDPALAALNIDPHVESKGWWGLTPRYVVGINNSVQYCPTSAGAQLNEASCSTGNWPKVEYIWPDGMPRRMYVAQGTFSVINPDGARTDYIHTPHSKCGGALTCNDYQRNMPRLVKIKPASSNQITTNYSYKNTSSFVVYGIAGYYIPKDTGMLSSSWDGNDLINYDLNKTRLIGGQVAELIQNSSGYNTITQVSLTVGGGINSGKPIKIDSWNYQALFNLDGTVQRYGDAFKQVVSTMIYDARQNVTSITSQGGTQYAEYEASCTTANEKYCNKPKWIQDPKGNKTYMTYHPESGQIATITSPVNKKGISAVTRYQYEQKSAYYYTAPGVKTYGSPIWMLVREKTCINTATQGDACAGGSTDEVIKTYEYNNDNLLLSAITVTAADTNNLIKTLRTCYQYDVYGNQIGATEPRANLTSCEARY